MEMEKYNVYLRTIQSSAIRTLSEALKEVLTDINIHFDDTGFLVNEIDKNRTAFIHLKLEAKQFEQYYCPRPFRCGISVTSLHKLLKSINNSDVVTLYVEKDVESLCMKIENEEKKSTSRPKLRLLDVNICSLDIPSIEFDYTHTMQCSDFQKHCRDLLLVAEEVDIYSNGPVLKMDVKGSYGENTIEIGKDEESLDKEFVFIGRYSLKYLSLVCKSSSLCQTIMIYLKPEFPIILEYSVASLGAIKFGISPIKIFDN